MGSKVIAFLGILLAMVLLISSGVAARELVETSNVLDTSSEKTNGAGVDGVNYPGVPGYGGFPGSGYNGPPSPGGGYPGGSGYCPYGCCGRNYYTGGCQCCSFAGEKADVATQAEPQN